MSYQKPDTIPEEQNDIYRTLHTAALVRVLDCELKSVGLCLTNTRYFKNEYCGDRGKGHERKCGCPHWLQVQIESFPKRFYEPNFWVWICKRKSVYEIRFTDSLGDSFVDNDFWISNERDRTQGKGSYIHSYGLKQVATDIQIAHQASEIKHYKSKDYDEYYAQIFREKEKE